MRQGYITEIKREGDSQATPICDEESFALANQNKTNISQLNSRVLSLEETLAYLNLSNTWFGCKWPIGNGNSEGTPIGNLFRLKHMQEIFKLGGYMVKNDHSRRKLYPLDHRIYEEGDAVDFTGAHGHYQWGWGVGIYYGAWSDASYEYEAFDDRPIPGVPCVYIPVGSRSCAGFAQLDRTNNKLVSYINKTAQYRGGNNSNWDDTYRSLIGKPVANIGMPTLRNYARNNGNMWFTTERVMIFITGALARVFFHNRNIQAEFNPTLTADGLHQGGLGYGISLDGVEWDNQRGYNPYIDLDAGIELGDFTGVFSTKITNSAGNEVTVSGIPSFMGLKNFYKYLWTMTEDELLICQADGSQAFYVEENIDGSIFNTDGAGTHLLVGKTPNNTQWSYIKQINKDYLSGMPTEVGGTDASFYADGYYNPHVTTAGAVRGAIRLGSADDGGTAGSCCLYGNRAPSYANAGGGAVLCEFTEPFSTKLTVLASA